MNQKGVPKKQSYWERLGIATVEEKIQKVEELFGELGVDSDIDIGFKIGYLAMDSFKKFKDALLDNICGVKTELPEFICLTALLEKGGRY